MKKFLFLSIAIVYMIVNQSFAQTLYQDDFESYTVNQGIAQQSTTWDTWSSSPGTAEDPTVSDLYSLSGTNSVKVSGTNDGVIVLNDLDSNRYRIEFYIYIPTGKQAYYNLMQNFDPAVTANNIWGMQIFFQDSVVTIDGGGAAAATFPFIPDTWIKMQHFVDLDNDLVDIYVNDTLVHAYQWSQGTFNDGTGLNKLDAINFYAWNVGGTPEYYMDNMLIEKVPSPESAQNFTLQIVNTNDVKLDWNSPLNESPLSYSVVRDGHLIANIVNDSTFTDTNLYPNTYNYKLIAYYGNNLGYSASAGSLDAVIPGGNQRELVLFEIFTGTWCSYCPTAASSITQMENQNLDIAVIEYHGGDSFETPSTDVRTDYYTPLLFGGDPIGYPGSVINGMYAFSGALPTIAQHKDLYEYYYEKYMEIPTVHNIEANVSNVSGYPYNFDIAVSVEETFPYYNDEMRLMVALTETYIPHNWNGLTQVKNVLRKMYPNANGTVVDFTSGTTQNFTFTLELESTYNAVNTRAVIFLQNRVTGQIMDVELINIGALVNNIEETDNAQHVMIYPNPVKDKAFIGSKNLITSYQVFDVAGKLLLDNAVESYETEVDFTSLTAGVYFLKIYSGDALSVHKIIKE
ncbi:MAG: T9SS type A sorting domain-containing protein [Bacteroidales bacterium]|nr:T9SS type A sorting domain-containing protein [Bacteroidales bacterium]